MELRDPEETNNGFICYHNSFCTIFVRNCPSVHICLMKKTRYVLKGVVYHSTILYHYLAGRRDVLSFSNVDNKGTFCCDSRQVLYYFPSDFEPPNGAQYFNCGEKITAKEGWKRGKQGTSSREVSGKQYEENCVTLLPLPPKKISTRYLPSKNHFLKLQRGIPYCIL